MLTKNLTNSSFTPFFVDLFQIEVSLMDIDVWLKRVESRSSNNSSKDNYRLSYLQPQLSLLIITLALQIYIFFILITRLPLLLFSPRPLHLHSVADPGGVPQVQLNPPFMKNFLLSCLQLTSYSLTQYDLTLKELT